MYHTSGKFRLVKRPRPRREPRARQLRRHVEGKDRTRAHAGHSCNAGHRENRLGRPPTRNFRRHGTETSKCRAPPRSRARRERQVPAGLQDPPSFPVQASITTGPPAASRLPTCLRPLGPRASPLVPCRPGCGSFSERRSPLRPRPWRLSQVGAGDEAWRSLMPRGPPSLKPS